MTTPPRTPARRPLLVRFWWSLTALAVVAGLGSVLVGEAGAQKKSSDASVTVDRVDATGDVVVAEGSVRGADPASVRVASAETSLEVTGVDTVGAGLRNDVVAVIDTTASLGNATVQLAKQGLDPLGAARPRWPAWSRATSPAGPPSSAINLGGMAFSDPANTRLSINVAITSSR